MDSLEGMLLVPPERGQIIGRANWKARYILIGRRPPVATRETTSNHRHVSSSSRVVPPILKSVTQPYNDDLCISVYKARNDYEPIQQWPVRLVSDCQVQMLSHRKQAPVLPTLVITLSDKERKRRSSRAAGLISTNKESGATTLWFRAAPDDPEPTLQEWAYYILSKRASEGAGTPISPIFTSPFASRPNESTDAYGRPGSGNNNTGRSDVRGLHHKSSTATYSTGPRDMPLNFSSESTSLRSKRSDLSSPSSHTQAYKPGYMKAAHHQHGTNGPIEEYNGDFIEGWTSAQGRSTINATTHGTDPMSSTQSPTTTADMYDVNSPPAPGETILDRAFKLGHIPFAEERIPGQEKLSSIARFDALMREADEKRRVREENQQAQQLGLRSAFDDEDSSAESASEGSDRSSIREPSPLERDTSAGALISPGAQRALAFIAKRHDEPTNQRATHRPSVSRNHLSFHATSASISQLAPSRPHTAHSKGRPNPGRTKSTPHLVPASTGVDVSTLPTTKNAEHAPRRAHGENRNSISSNKRLSITDITKRLSSTSSLLLVQTNVSGSSSRASTELDPHTASHHRTNLSIRPPPPRSVERDDRKCGWGGSIGVVGTEGGFL